MVASEQLVRREGLVSTYIGSFSNATQLGYGYLDANGNPQVAETVAACQFGAGAVYTRPQNLPDYNYYNALKAIYINALWMSFFRKGPTPPIGPNQLAVGAGFLKCVTY
jgi:hypothetical protein